MWRTRQKGFFGEDTFKQKKELDLNELAKQFKVLITVGSDPSDAEKVNPNRGMHSLPAVPRQPGSAWFRLVQTGSAWFSLVQTGPAWFSLDQPGSDRCSWVLPGSDRFRPVQIGSPWCRSVKSGNLWGCLTGRPLDPVWVGQSAAEEGKREKLLH